MLDFEHPTADPLSSLWTQHPAPWVVDDNREGNEGEVTVYDDADGVVVYVGDMEDCAMADIQLANAIAALPKLLEACRAALSVLDWSEEDKDERTAWVGFSEFEAAVQRDNDEEDAEAAIALLRGALAVAHGREDGTKQ